MEKLEEVVVRQPEGERFEVGHHGGVALHGSEKLPAMRHHVDGQMVHTTAPKQPLVHMVCWDEDRPCEVKGRITLAGDDQAPVRVRMAHEFTNTHQQTHAINPVDHTLHVDSQLARPIHHALQIRTPLQVRFCNSWHLASDYMVEIRVGESRLASIRLTGATVVTPQPCPNEEPCPTRVSRPDGP